MRKKYVIFLLFILSAIITNAQENQLCQGAYWTEDEGFLKHQEFASEWNDKASWEERAAKIKNQIITGMQLDKMPKIEGNFNAIINGTKKMDGYIVENIAIESFPGFYVTGNLYRPLDEEGKHPAILTPHGHWISPDNHGRFRKDVQIRSAAFARMGAIVFAYDMVGYGEATQVDHHISIAMVLQTYNSKRVLEYLLSRNDVDSENIGMTGASGGGTQTFILTAIDSRITASAPVCQVSAHFFGGCVCESGVPIHKVGDFQTSNVEIAALTAPRPLLMVSNGADWTRNTPRVEYPYVKSVYKVYNAENRISNAHFVKERHDYGVSKRKAVYNFLSQYLNLTNGQIPRGGDGYSEDFVTILTYSNLKVFGEDNKFPKNALDGDEAVMEYLGISN